MLGAIIGDVVGSRFEFNNTSKPSFTLFSSHCAFTDDTICTVAVAQAILAGTSFQKEYLTWGRRYPHPMGGYGSLYKQWLYSAVPMPYNSWGNGAAMRVSPIGWAYNSREEVEAAAVKTALPTHNHPEGIKGAVVVALGVYLLRTHDSSFDTLVDEFYGEDWRDHLPVRGYFDPSCQGCVPLAFHLLSEADSFEDALRRTIVYGGDSDTMAAIVGALAEVRYGIDDTFVAAVQKYLPDDMLQVVTAFRKKYC